MCDPAHSTSETEALQHLAQAEQALALIPGVPADTPVLPLASAAVIGAGTMGAGIARALAEAAIYALINEGTRIFDEGFVPRLSDIDDIFLNGFGFPARRGGPMWYADPLGLKQVYNTIAELHQRFGDPWRPAPLLERLARTGGSFYPQTRKAAA